MIHKKSIAQLLENYSNNYFSPAEVVASTLKHAEMVNESLNCFSHLGYDYAIERAKYSEERWLKKKPLSKLDGIPISIKEFIDLKGWPNNRASLAIESITSPNNAVIVDRLEEAGAIIIGKTRSPEMNWKGTTDSPGFGLTKNPLNPNLTPGGSSGGCAAAVASGVVRLSIGSDAAGSVRIPAAFCGVTGFKPSYGAIPLTPYPGHFSELAHIGPIGVSPKEIQDIFKIILGSHHSDLSSFRFAQKNLLALQKKNTKKIACLNINSLGLCDDLIVKNYSSFIEKIKAKGYSVETFNFSFDEANEVVRFFYKSGCFYTTEKIAQKNKHLIDKELLSWVQECYSYKAIDYLEHLQKKIKLCAEINSIFNEADVIITPTLPVLPFALGSISPEGYDQDDWFSWNKFTPIFNLAHLPAITIPFQLEESFPIGIQIAGKYNDDFSILALAEELRNI